MHPIKHLFSNHAFSRACGLVMTGVGRISRPTNVLQFTGRVNGLHRAAKVYPQNGSESHILIVLRGWPFRRRLEVFCGGNDISVKPSTVMSYLRPPVPLSAPVKMMGVDAPLPSFRAKGLPEFYNANLEDRSSEN